jgi:hypothetical protein
MYNIKLSVRELVEFVYKSGDLNIKRKRLDRALEGIQVHKALQSEMGENYQKEFSLKQEIIYKDISFFIEGRADGIITEIDGITVDEIKSTYRNLEYLDEKAAKAHIAQVKCYGYMYCLQYNLENIKIMLRYYNIDTKNIKVFKYECSMIELENFLYELLDFYIVWAEAIIHWNVNKREKIEELEFPFSSYRSGQRDFSVAVFNTIRKGKKLFVQAPTGVGKTISTLFPAIKAMNFKKNSKIYYLTAKSSTKTVAFNAVKLMVEKGLNLRTVVITSKEKICFNEECNCDPEFCQYARGYYDKVNQIMFDTLKNDCLYDREYIENLCRKNEICPFEFSLDISYMADVVICDYNYYFDPRVAFQREDVFSGRNDILLIDEAHNLEDRARNMYSPEIIKEEFYEVYKNMKGNKKITKGLYKINKKILDVKRLKEENNYILTEQPVELIKALKKFSETAAEYFNDPKNEDIPPELMDVYFKSTFLLRLPR